MNLARVFRRFSLRISFKLQVIFCSSKCSCNLKYLGILKIVIHKHRKYSSRRISREFSEDSLFVQTCSVVLSTFWKADLKASFRFGGDLQSKGFFAAASAAPRRTATATATTTTTTQTNLALNRKNNNIFMFF